jgi:hypothetical protein
MSRSRRAACTLLLATGIACAVVSCRDYMPQNRYLRPRNTQVSYSTAEARHKFDHARHAAILRETGTTCVSCHRFDARVETSNPGLATALSGAGLLAGTSACHYCHGPSETRIAAAPGACTTCHTDLTPLIPADHQIAWLRVHASVASADPAACQNCHRDSFCVNCHQNRDSILTFMHDRNYLSYHGVDARANPIQCGSCHREDYCLRCHAQVPR